MYIVVVDEDFQLIFTNSHNYICCFEDDVLVLCKERNVTVFRWRRQSNSNR